MKKTIVIICIVLLTITAFSQSSSYINISYYRNYDKNENLIRTNGVIFDFQKEKLMSETYSLLFGIGFNISEDKSTQQLFRLVPINDSTFVKANWGEFKERTLALGLEMPIYLKVKLLNSKFYILNGLNINIERIFLYHLDDIFLEPELNKGSKLRTFSIGYSVSLLYKISDVVQYEIGFRNASSKYYDFNYFTMGLKIRISNRSN